MRGNAAVGVALPPQFASGSYKVSYRIWLPRAMEVTWTLRCGEHEESGVVGETFEQYQVRRVAELQRERAEERQRRAQVGSLIGGAVLGRRGDADADEQRAGDGDGRRRGGGSGGRGVDGERRADRACAR